MEHTKKTILIKLSGELFSCGARSNLAATAQEFSHAFIAQLNELRAHARIGIVVGGGNFFRGANDGETLGLPSPVAHEIGMLATILNGRILQSWCNQAGIPTSLMSAVPCPTIAKPLCQQTITYALHNAEIVIFVGGSGNPFFTTDTTAVIRALQIGAIELWKATKVNGVYSADPLKDTSATLLKETTYAYALKHQLGIMDATALTLAQEHKLVTRVFNACEKNAFIHTAKDASFGSKINA